MTFALKGEVQLAQRQIRYSLNHRLETIAVKGEGVNNRKYFVDIINGQPLPLENFQHERNSPLLKSWPLEGIHLANPN